MVPAASECSYIPSVVGASTPSFAKWIFAIVCWVAAGVQILGFLAVRQVRKLNSIRRPLLTGIAQERPILYRRYVTLHCLLSVAAFGVAAAWIIISATRHKQAQSKCITQFFGNTVSATNSEGQTLCNIFPWADVGIMGGLWILFAIVQVGLFIASAISVVSNMTFIDVPLRRPVVVRQGTAPRSLQILVAPARVQ